MKRLAIVLAICMLLPLNAFALQPMSEDTMGEVTGQSGVSIAVDDIKIYQNIANLAYTDNDGVYSPMLETGNNTAGSINISNLHMMVNINGITSASGGVLHSPGRALMGTYTGLDATNVVNPATGEDITGAFLGKALTIDVGTMAVLSEGLVNFNTVMGAIGRTDLVKAESTIAGVRIGLPTVEIVQSDISLTVTVTSAGAFNTNADFGTITIGEQTMAVLDGFVEIAPH